MSAFSSDLQIDGTYSDPNAQPQNQPTSAAYKNQPAKGKTWELLKAKHSSYESDNKNHIKEEYLYNGGFEMNSPEIAQLFCPRLKNEEDTTTYNDRVASASYKPIFSKLITGLVSTLFSEDLTVVEASDHNDSSTSGQELTPVLRNFYKEFSSNCDQNGTDLHSFFNKQATEALVHRTSYFGLDYPVGEADSLLEQEQKLLDKPFLYHIDFSSVWDYMLKEGSDHEFAWVKLGFCQHSQPTPFDQPKIQFLIVIITNNNGIINYEHYLTPAVLNESLIKNKDIIPQKDSGVLSFKSIPIFRIHLDNGIAVGARLAPLAAEHFNRSTIENWSTNRACITIPVMYNGLMMPDGDGLPSPQSADLNRGRNPKQKVNNKGILDLGDFRSDRFEIVEAEGKALSFIHMQNKDLEEEMHSVVHQMAQSLKQATSKAGKTASSKMEDRRSSEMLLTSIANAIYHIVKRVFTVIGKSRNEDIVFDAKGLSTLQSEDRDSLMLEFQTLSTLNFPSLTQQKEQYYRVGSRLVEGCGEEVMQTIRKEIEDNLQKKWDMQEDAAVNPAAVDPSSMEAKQFDHQQKQDNKPQKKL